MRVVPPSMVIAAPLIVAALRQAQSQDHRRRPRRGGPAGRWRFIVGERARAPRSSLRPVTRAMRAATASTIGVSTKPGQTALTVSVGLGEFGGEAAHQADQRHASRRHKARHRARRAGPRPRRRTPAGSSSLGEQVGQRRLGAVERGGQIGGDDPVPAVAASCGANGALSAIPALTIRKSIGPLAARASSKARSIASRSVTSQGMAVPATIRPRPLRAARAGGRAARSWRPRRGDASRPRRRSRCRRR